MQCDGIKELVSTQRLHPGGHNWPDMQIVIDPSQADIEDNGIYLVQVRDRDPVVKCCVTQGGVVMLHPALSAVHGQRTVELFGRKVPCQSIEFSDGVYARHLTVCGKVVGIWAGTTT